MASLGGRGGAYAPLGEEGRGPRGVGALARRLFRPAGARRAPFKNNGSLDRNNGSLDRNNVFQEENNGSSNNNAIRGKINGSLMENNGSLKENNGSLARNTGFSENNGSLDGNNGCTINDGPVDTDRSVGDDGRTGTGGSVPANDGCQPSNHNNNHNNNNNNKDDLGLYAGTFKSQSCGLSKSKSYCDLRRPLRTARSRPPLLRPPRLLWRSTSGSMGATDNTLQEEASLLGGEAGEELRHIRLSVAAVRSLVSDGSLGEPQQVETEHGPVTVAVTGDSTKPCIVAYHDLGLNHVTNFQSFFHYPDMRALLSSFQLVCINAPGQEEGAPSLPPGYEYPTMEQLAQTVERVRAHLGLRTIIGLGVGLGANVLTRYALAYPHHVDALVLLNNSVGQAGWVEWGYQKLNIRQLRGGAMTAGTVDYLLWHHFGKPDQCSPDVVAVYRQLFEGHERPGNLGPLMEAYVGRTDLGIVREMDPNKKKGARMVRVPVLNVTSNHSAHVDDTVAFNGRLDPSNSSWMKIQDCGLVLEEQPAKMAEALRLFLQGQGYAIHTRRLGARQNSLPLIGGLPGGKGGALLPSVADDEGQEEGQDPPASQGQEPPAGQDPPASQDPPATQEPDVSVVGGGSDTDIRITENPLEQPAV